MGVSCLHPSISDCHMRSFAHLGVARLLPSILITHPDFLYLPIAVLLYAHLPTAPPPIVIVKAITLFFRVCVLIGLRGANSVTKL